MTAIVVAENLGRWYGQVAGLNEVSLSITGGITGLVGVNGAGKSTLIKLLVGEIRPSRGSIQVLGREPFANRAYFRKIGFCPQQDALYDQLTGFGMVKFLLRLSGFSPSKASRTAAETLQRVGMTDAMHRRIGGYSKGMRQRVKIAQAIAHEPELLICDEPLNGLDSVGRRDMLELLSELGNSGVHILVSSHVLHEIENLTENIVLLHRGRVLAQGTVPEVRDLLTRFPRRIEIKAGRARQCAEAIMPLEHVLSVRITPETGVLKIETCDIDQFYRDLTAIVAAGELEIGALEAVDAGLEAVFDYLVD
ncbi:MAG: ABC transporter ATP-binding protein [Planctomycetota bacterium]|nr:ABC transporter ATP-binding protein [Planctomycetota bacterium]